MALSNPEFFLKCQPAVLQQSNFIEKNEKFHFIECRRKVKIILQLFTPKDINKRLSKGFLI